MAAATTKTINAFENQLNTALRQASVSAAVAVIQGNPDMTLEDFYSVMRPQGVTTTITLGEIYGALNGCTPAPHRTMTAPEPDTVAPAAKRRKPGKPPEVNCLSHVGMQAYHTSILQYLASTRGWVSGPEAREYCGGTKAQFNIAIRKHLVPEGFVKTNGKFGGMVYTITPKGMNRAPEDAVVDAPLSGSYRDIITKFLQENRQWHSGEDISNACGGTSSARRQALIMLVNSGLIERNGMYTTLIRYRAV